MKRRIFIKNLLGAVAAVHVSGAVARLPIQEHEPDDVLDIESIRRLAEYMREHDRLVVEFGRYQSIRFIPSSDHDETG